MSATVRVFYLDSVVTAPVSSSSGRYTTDSVQLLKLPYLSRSSATVTTGSAGSVTAAPANTKMALIQVQNGKSVHIEANPPNRSTDADTGSPIIIGDVYVVCGPDWTFSFLETA